MVHLAKMEVMGRKEALECQELLDPLDFLGQEDSQD